MNRILVMSNWLLIGLFVSVFASRASLDAQVGNLAHVRRALRDNFPPEILKAEFTRPKIISTRGGPTESVYESTVSGIALIGFRDRNVGGGVLVSDSGDIVTNEHVVRDAYKEQGESWVSVAFIKEPSDPRPNREQLLLAKVLRRDVVHDLAVIRLLDPLPANARVIPLAKAPVKVGATVYAFGHPLNFLWSFDNGIVSQIRPEYVWKYIDGVERRATVIQTNAALNPGSSGGPLLNEGGQVVGVVAWGRQDGPGLNFAISLQHIEAILK